MDDDLFQSLGGSLMKDLLADLQGDEGEGNGWLSLEQLEKELSQLDDSSAPDGPSLGSLPLPPAPSAASMVVSQQQQQQPVHGVGLLGDVTVTKAPAEAWKEQLEKFTAMSLDQDFLAADTVRKQKQQAVPPQLPPGFLAEAQDYDEQEKATVMPPPGLGSRSSDITDVDKQLRDQLASSLLPGGMAPSMPEGKPMPKTPQNSLSVGGQMSQSSQKGSRVPKTPRNSVIVSSSKESSAIEEGVAMTGKVTILKKEPKAGDQAEQPHIPTKIPRNPVAAPSQEQAQAVAQGVGVPHPIAMQQGMPPPQYPGMPQHLAMIPQGLAMPPGGPAWQTVPPPPPTPQMRIFCNPHPSAPPIPAGALESRWMKSRDITYIIHSMLKPVLAAGFSDKDYDIQFLYRQNGGRPAGPRFRGKKSKKDDPAFDALQKEMESRAKKSKEWAAKNAALGAVAKSDVTRPRALIASPVMSTENNDNSEGASEQKQRARLWKARIYCDQAYQSYLTVVDIWAQAAPGTVPPQVHAPLIKLMKCLGTVPVSAATEESTSPDGLGEFQVDESVLGLFLKLSKGRTLFARIAEQALLPPSAVQAVLPVALKILYSAPPQMDNKQAASAYGSDMTDDRIFRALSSVIQTLPNLSGDVVLQSVDIMKSNSDAALSSTARMECLHALLQRGSSMASNSDSSIEDYKAKWTETETSFMNILSGM